ncbi:MAG: apolipoprotein acyltransferase, partial [Beijerinckiaceae bacterium]|nr:apolipoprotein acyltransferase [Beijerinckiaceae bacterium]
WQARKCSIARSFSEHIDDLYEKAGARAREIAAVLAETSQISGSTIESQFAGIRASIGEERERTAAELRAACEQANADLERHFGQTAQRFQSAAVDVRDMSREILRELEETREALRRGAADLPQETAQQAAALRRAVADQIKALEELSDIVTRSGRAYDISQPVSFGAERAALLPAAPRRIEPVRPQEPARTPAQAPGAAGRPASTKATERGSGWISDLLARVDSEEPRASQIPPAKSTQAPQRLEAISLDVTRMIDHAAAADAWERYRRGETNAFSRQIYVGRGPQAFEEIRRRYRLDPEFHATVDRYVQEFERLLAELGHDAADEAVAKTYLLSETGKVYTLLAHAAGKLT